MVEIFAEAAVRDGLLELDARGGDEGQVDGFRAGAAQAAHGAVFEDGEELGLQGGGQQADLVEEEGASGIRPSDPGV
jgi:hypothetical protein